MKEKETQDETEPKVEEIRVATEVTITDVELEELRAQAADFKHKYLHLLADSDNARKRMLKERQELIDYASRNLILEFLHPIDHMENALKFTEDASDEVKHWAAGFVMILNQFKDVLTNHGIKPVESIGKQFDPHLHDAIEMVETDEHPPGVVIEENIKGYVIGDKVLRPARVKVSKEVEEIK